MTLSISDAEVRLILSASSSVTFGACRPIKFLDESEFNAAALTLEHWTSWRHTTSASLSAIIFTILGSLDSHELKSLVRLHSGFNDVPGGCSKNGCVSTVLGFLRRWSK
jgi:hypothetical protein